MRTDIKKSNYIKSALLVFFCLLVSCLAQAKTIEITGQPEEPFTEYLHEYDALEETLIIKDGRIYISARFRDSSADIGSGVYTRHYINNFLLPDTVKFDKKSGELFYAGDEGRTSIGSRKLVLGFFPRVVLRENVKIITSPYDARLIIMYPAELRRAGEEPSTRDMIENLLSQRCTQCHTVNYILEKPGDWTNENWLHVLHRMQSKGPALLSKDEAEAIAQYLAFQKKEIRAKEIREPEQVKKLKQTYLLKETDVKLFEKNKCIKCHTIDRVLVMHRSRPWSKERWTDIIKRMKEKDPEIMEEIDVEEVVDFLYELKKLHIRKEKIK